MKILLSAILIGLLSACQTTNRPYNVLTVPTPPKKADLSESEYAVKLLVHLFPRRCITFRHFSTNGDDRTGPTNYVRDFDIHEVYKNSLGNGWYNAKFSSSFASDKIYINTESTKIVCGKKDWKTLTKKKNILGKWKPESIDTAHLFPPEPNK